MKLYRERAMEIKWKEDYSAKTQRYWGVVIGGVGGALGTLCLQGFYTSWAMFANVSWLELMTAIGTVGAMLAALWIYKKSSRQLENQEIAGIYEVFTIFKTVVFQVYSVSKHIENILSPETEQGKRLESFEVSAIRVRNYIHQVDKISWSSGRNIFVFSESLRVLNNLSFMILVLDEFSKGAIDENRFKKVYRNLMSSMDVLSERVEELTNMNTGWLEQTKNIPRRHSNKVLSVNSPQ